MIIGAIFLFLGIVFIIPEVYNMNSFEISDYLEETLELSEDTYNNIMIVIFVLFVLGFIFIGVGIILLITAYMKKK